ncbi:MAG TPA: hypothetical protein VGR73_22845 [Bryobacteraceae bacterium]|nr:hypothetical protein [Bryobacteraceae bacterium]
MIRIATTAGISLVGMLMAGTALAQNGVATDARTSASQSGSFTIADRAVAIGREPAVFPFLSFIGSMPHVPAETGWNTTFTFVNKGMAAATVDTNLFARDGTPLVLPLTLPQQQGDVLLTSTLGGIIAPNATFVIEASSVIEAAGLVNTTAEGSAQLSADGTVDGFAIFHFDPDNQEAVVPMETRNAASYLLAFDNTGGVLTGVALANVSASMAIIPMTIRDDTGALVTTSSIVLAGSGHTSFVLSDPMWFPMTANIRGTVEFDTPPGGQISTLGIRYTPGPVGGTTTTIPALANVSTAGGLMAHLAAGNGWETTFVLVNTGGAAAQAHLKFFDKGGNPLPLPLSFPQIGGGPSTATATLDQTIAAGASLWVRVTLPAGAAYEEGSAQLSTDGNIGGFAIFRWDPNGQEAVVPLESRNAPSYLIAYDNTGGIVTGIAISGLSQFTTLVPVTLRDETGAVLNTGSIPLGPNGHRADTATNLFPQTAGIRGTIEFNAPQGAQISILGIRTPPALTFTTLPPLAP